MSHPEVFQKAPFLALLCMQMRRKGPPGQNRPPGSQEMAQAVGSLLCKPKEQSSDPSTCRNSQPGLMHL